VDGGNTDTATGTIPLVKGDLAYTGGISAGAGLLGLVLVGGGLLLIRSRRRQD
jgi:LPXTG-motif cell wall-anchored protein